jgi:hypothetical protein
MQDRGILSKKNKKISQTNGGGCLAENSGSKRGQLPVLG